jgi:5-methylcytosine-specific restriction endonuclease McrA
MQVQPKEPFRMRTLVLNAGFEPLAVVSFRRALMLVMNNKATVVKADVEHPVLAENGAFDRPSVILLQRYVKVPYVRRIPVTRRAVLRRDANRCAYCSAPANTIDHVLPRSRGGADSWENLVACCFRCNNVKGDRTPQEMGWRLRMTPKMPVGAAWFALGADRRQQEWEDFLAPAATIEASSAA